MKNNRVTQSWKKSELDYYNHKVNVGVVEQYKADNLKKLGSLRKIPEKLRIDGKSPTVLENCRKSFQGNTKEIQRKIPMLLNFDIQIKRLKRFKFEFEF